MHTLGTVYCIGQFSWIRQPRNLTAVIGSDVFIPCEFSGVGHIRPYWRHNNNELFHTLDLPPGYSFNNSGLIINEIMASMNMSSYSCYLDLFDGAQESSVGYITLVEVSVAPTAVTGNHYTKIAVVRVFVCEHVDVCVCVCGSLVV